jgi:hypothetical protein
LTARNLGQVFIHVRVRAEDAEKDRVRYKKEYTNPEKQRFKFWLKLPKKNLK